MEKISVAQIGVGYWGPNLLRNLDANPLCNIKYASDSSPSRRDYISKTFCRVQAVDDYHVCLEDPEIEAVVIATPVCTHHKIAMEALQAGKHILVEKPLATSVAQAEEITMLARQKNLVVMAGHTFIYHSAVRYLKELIESGELGQVRYIYSQRLNLGRIRSDVDAWWNLAPHDISIIQYLFGDPTPVSVKRHGMDYVQRGIDDVVFVNIVYPNRIMVNIHVSWLDPNRTRRMVIVGSEKMAVYDDDLKDKVMIFDKGIDRMAVLGQNMDYDHPGGFSLSHRSGLCHIPKIDYVEPLQAEISHFIDCIANGTECLTGPTHAIRVIKILSQCQKSPDVMNVSTAQPPEAGGNGTSAGAVKVQASQEKNKAEIKAAG